MATNAVGKLTNAQPFEIIFTDENHFDVHGMDHYEKGVPIIVSSEKECWLVFRYPEVFGTPIAHVRPGVETFLYPQAQEATPFQVLRPVPYISGKPREIGPNIPSGKDKNHRNN